MRIIAVCLLAVCSVIAVDSEPQIWSDKAGNLKFRGEVVRLGKDSVTLRRSDTKREVTIPIARLSKECQERVRTLKAQTSDSEDGPSGGAKRKETWAPFLPNCDVLCDTSYEFHPGNRPESPSGGELKLNNGALIRATDVPMLKRVTGSYNDTETRTKIIDGLTRLWFGFDEVENKLRVEPLRYVSGPYAFYSHVSFQGLIPLDGKPPQVLLTLQYCGENWIFADRATILADSEKWETPVLKFNTHNSGSKVKEIAYLDLGDPGIFSRAAKLAIAKRAIVRFQGPERYSDLVLSDRMKADVGAGLLAFTALGLHREAIKKADAAESPAPPKKPSAAP